MKRMLASLAGLAMVVLTLNGCGKEEPTAATAQAAPQDVFEWKMVTTWPRNYPG
ncbi:MAG TPA: ABC transporter substrate-binding protein, partial [Gammaproteobacteria bacterium]|nr:ABC transporter substrate-binding protein [Gammaproteobacteria bacterium]